MGPVASPTVIGTVSSMGTDAPRGCGTLTARVRTVTTYPLTVTSTLGKPDFFEDLLGNVQR